MTRTSKSPAKLADNASEVAAAVPVRLLRAPTVIAVTGLSRTTIWRRIKDGTFPKPRSVDGTITVWSSAEINEWIERQLNQPASA